MTDAPIPGFSLRIDPTWPYRNLWIHPLGEIINLTYVDFEGGISDSSSPNYAETEIPGRGESYSTYINTTNKEITFTTQFRVQGTGALAMDREVVQPARWLDACKHPIYDDATNLMVAPPPLLLRIGRLYFIRGVITSADITWTQPFDTITLLPHGAEVSVTMKVVRRYSPDMGYRYESITQGVWR